MKEKLPKKVRDALFDLVEDMNSMIGCATDYEESFENGGLDTFDELNKKRIDILRKYFKL